MPSARPPKRFLQFNVRQLFILVALLGALLAIVMPRIRRARHLSQLQADARRRQAASHELVAAVKANDVAQARRALEAGATVNAPANDPNQMSLLCSSIAKGRIEMMELLLDYGAEVDREQTGHAMQGGYPLFTAVECGLPAEIRRRMVRRLIARGADPGTARGNETLMDIAVRLFDADIFALLRERGLPYGPREMAAFNLLDELKQAVAADRHLLQERFKPVWACDPGAGPTLLSISLAGGYRKMALFLIDSGAPLDTIVYRKSTLLHQAARGGNAELIRLLVARGLDVGARDVYDDTPLIVAAEHSQADAVAALLEAGSDVNHRDVSQRTALFYAEYHARPDIVEMLVAAGADRVPRNGDTERGPH